MRRGREGREGETGGREGGRERERERAGERERERERERRRGCHVDCPQRDFFMRLICGLFKKFGLISDKKKGWTHMWYK